MQHVYLCCPLCVFVSLSLFLFLFIFLLLSVSLCFCVFLSVFVSDAWTFCYKSLSFSPSVSFSFLFFLHSCSLSLFLSFSLCLSRATVNGLVGLGPCGWIFVESGHLSCALTTGVRSCGSLGLCSIALRCGRTFGPLASSVVWIEPTFRGSAIPKVKTIEGGFVMPKILSAKTLFMKFFGLRFFCLSGFGTGQGGASRSRGVPLVKHVGQFVFKVQAQRVPATSSHQHWSYEEVSSMVPQKTMIRSLFVDGCHDTLAA